MRINGSANVHDALSSYISAQRVVRVEVEHIYPNRPRCLPETEMKMPSRHIPETGRTQPMPEWKPLPPIAELL